MLKKKQNLRRLNVTILGNFNSIDLRYLSTQLLSKYFDTNIIRSNHKV